MLNFFAFLVMVSGQTQTEFAQIWKTDFANAIAFIESAKTTFYQQFDGDYEKTAMASAIIFPELIRYSSIRDFFESQSLELAYVEFGLRAVDFSIGNFQMKPSFAEQIEVHVTNSALRNQYPHLELTQHSSADARKIRIERLKSTPWQMTYLAAFIDILHVRFTFLNNETPTFKVAYMSAAYNLGIDATRSEIERWMQTPAFPDGKNAWTKQYAYAQIALYYFENYAPKLFAISK